MTKKIFLSLTLLLIGKAYSQIVHTSVTPNFEINLAPITGSEANLFPIDFNNDGTVDFNFRWDVFSPGTYFMHITSSNTNTYNPNNQVIGSGTSNSFSVPYAMPLSAGTPIVGTSTGWITEQRGPLISDAQNTNFLGLGDRYIGVRFFVGGQYYYGWILVSFVANKLIIKSYAYQTNPNLEIIAGNTGGTLGVDNHYLNSTIKLYPNPAVEYIKISGIKGNTQYQIYNGEGKIVKTGMIDAKNEISARELVSGSYIISVKNNNHQYKIKFIKK
jgi:hypothetical protein